MMALRKFNMFGFLQFSGIHAVQVVVNPFMWNWIDFHYFNLQRLLKSKACRLSPKVCQAAEVSLEDERRVIAWVSIGGNNW